MSTSTTPRVAAYNITGIVLCGGAGQRIGGQDKPLVLLNGRPLIEHVHARVQPQVARVVISCNRNHHRYAEWSDRCVHDDLPGLGPLGGIASALRHVHTDWAFICPGDVPHLARDLVARLVAGYEQAHTQATMRECVTVPHDGMRLQPLFMLLPAARIESIQAYLAAGARSVHGWLAHEHLLIVPCRAIATSFANANSPAELCALHAAPTDLPDVQSGRK